MYVAEMRRVQRGSIAFPLLDSQVGVTVHILSDYSASFRIHPKVYGEVMASLSLIHVVCSI